MLVITAIAGPPEARVLYSNAGPRASSTHARILGPRLRRHDPIGEARGEFEVEEPHQPPGGEIVGQRDAAPDRDTLAEACGIVERARIREARPARGERGRQAEQFQPRRPAQSRLASRDRRVVQQRRASEVRRAAQGTPPRAKLRGRAQEQRFAQKPVGAQARGGFARVADRDVDRLAAEIDVGALGVQHDVDLGITAAEIGQPAHEPTQRERRQRRNDEPAGTRAFAQRARRRGECREAFFEAGQIGAARVGQLEPARQPPEQLDAQMRLERGDMLADRGRRHRQFARRRDESAGTRGGFEGAQRVERRQAGRRQKAKYNLSIRSENPFVVVSRTTLSVAHDTVRQSFLGQRLQMSAAAAQAGLAL
jgi:hypothetical protein